jgi:hypothetical protein
MRRLRVRADLKVGQRATVTWDGADDTTRARTIVIESP